MLVDANISLHILSSPAYIAAFIPEFVPLINLKLIVPGIAVIYKECEKGLLGFIDFALKSYMLD